METFPIFEEYSEKDRASCIELLTRVFPSGSNEATFKWRFERGFEHKPIIVCAKHEGRVVSFNSWIPWKFSYEQKEYIGYQSGESATDPTFRGKGLFGKILKIGEKIAINKQIDFLFGFPSRLSFSSFYKANYIPIRCDRFSLRPLNPFLKREKKLDDIDHNDLFKFCGYSLSDYSKIALVTDLAYFAWRFLDNPKDYDIVEFNQNNLKIFHILLKKEFKGIPELVLLETITNSYNEKFIENSFKFLDRRFARKALYIRTFFNSNCERGFALQKHFPFTIKSKYYELVVRQLSNKIPNDILLNSFKWDIMPSCVDEL